MLKMGKYILESVDNVDLMAILPLIIFMVFFVIMTVIVLKKKKSYIDKMANLPFED